MRPHLAFLPILLLTLFSCYRQPADFEAALFLYNQNHLEEALPLFETLSEQTPNDARTLAYLAEIYRRFGKKEAAVATARKAIGIDPLNAFAYEVIGEASNPLLGQWEGADPETTWTYLLKATACDPKDGNPWLMIWGEAMRRGDNGMMTNAAEKMIETGFFTKAMLTYTEWVLESLPQNAILLTNGDMDTYPVAALQAVEELRPDVILVNRGGLNLAWAARYHRDVRGVPLPFSDDELDDLMTRADGGDGDLPSDAIIRGWIRMWKQGRMRNPIAFAATVPDEYAERFGEPLRYVGAAQLIAKGGEEGPDMGALRASLEHFRQEEFFGPWVSDEDRSPVRRVGTKNIVRNVVYAALTLTEGLIGEGRTEEASRWLVFADGLDNGSDLGPVYSARIRELKGRLAP